LVVAGAGSGKTKALTHRIAYLIREKQIPGDSIMAVTFTNKAAMEMQERVSNLLDGTPGYRPVIGTFHSICVRILRKHLHEMDMENNFVIYDTTDQKVLVKRIMKSMQMDEKQMNPKSILYAISNAKNNLIGPVEFATHAMDYFSQKVADVYEHYQDQLRINNALDFDDIIMKVVELFKKHPEILEFYQNKFRYLCVDEYQDTNHAQYVLIRQLANKYKNLMVIGDSDQSIYSWRGANMQNILDFEKDFRDCKVILLEQNYRSTKKILEAAHNVIIKNQKRKEKKLWTDNNEGEDIWIYEAYNEREEGIHVVNQISKILAKYESPDYGDFAILYRTNAQSRVLEEVLLKYGIPYRIVGGIKFYERKEIKDIMSYLKLLLNPDDSISLLRIINVPSRKLGAATILKVTNFASQKGISAYRALERVWEIEELSDSKKKDLEAFVKVLSKLVGMAQTEVASSIIKYVVEETGYKDMLQEENTVEAESRLENISELVSVASKYDSLEGGTSLTVFLEEVALISDADQVDENTSSVTLMTLHAAKGLEFPHVFMVGMEEGVFPSSRSMLDPEQMEEERRLMYVGVTRAEESLTMTFAKQRMLFGEIQANAPSQFLSDIPKKLVMSNSQFFGGREVAGLVSIDDMGRKKIPTENGGSNGSGYNFNSGYIGKGSGSSPSPAYNPDAADIGNYDSGDRVRHPKFGEGTVVAVIGGVVSIKFDDRAVGNKKLAISIAPIEKIG
jgi:DNA helicase-2/ATP-dependent DNA helicase PcrA